MDGEYITRTEHEEFSKRLDSENKRQNARIDKLEEATKSISDLTVSVSKMAVSMEGMLEEQKRQGKKIDDLENIPSKRWSQISGKAIDTVVAIIVTALTTGLIIMIAQNLK